ncbi:hypothetical protein FUAX_23150 [Fulvitalea axinellae]|uniref:Outer membrane protein beta-barrel domain-containing protein n=1 Tax=Fulvitalea axinellae TaxID=1182444 RepID=A0AAU9CIJ1_9BACT|nr:hypothetical protein FUAX_23150 [Fulvitalea axinellae]
MITKVLRYFVATVLAVAIGMEYSFAQNDNSKGEEELEYVSSYRKPAIYAGTSVMAGSGWNGYSYDLQGSVPVNQPRRRRQASYSANFGYTYQKVGGYTTSTYWMGPSMWMPLSDRMALNLDVRVGQQDVTGKSIMLENGNKIGGPDLNRTVYDINAELHYKISDKADLIIGARFTNAPSYGYGYGGYGMGPYGMGNYGFGAPPLGYRRF